MSALRLPPVLIEVLVTVGIGASYDTEDSPKLTTLVGEVPDTAVQSRPAQSHVAAITEI